MFLEPNLVLDIEAKNIERENFKRSIDPVISRIEYEEIVINKNERLTEQDILKLESLRKALSDMQTSQNYYELILSSFGQFLYNLIILTIFFYFSQIFFKEILVSLKNRIFIFSAIVLTIFIMVILFYAFNINNVLLSPIPLFILIVAMTFSPTYGIVFGLFIMIIAGQYLHWNMPPLINLVISSVVSLLIIEKTKQTNYVKIFVSLLASLVIFTIITALYRNDDFEYLSMCLLYCMINSVVSVSGTYFALPQLEDKFKLASRYVLLNLLNSDHPLLKRLAREAQGTYYHSLTVGVLAEECAEAIGANPLIARVGSHYHDIGKLEQPKCFIENITDKNIHDELSPIDSALIIKNHVTNGVTLAKKARIPQQVIDIITQHHGDNKIKYFLYKANEQGIDYNIEDFSYPGPKPQTKEAVIVMITDIVESTTKAIPNIDDSLIKKIIEDTINNLLLEEQLIEAPITTQDLYVIKQTMFPIICSIHRKRIEYPDEKK
jgi:putative nucleotidyltransferase with HDIG domain